MGRPRAGHGWTGFYIDDKSIHLLLSETGKWITTGQAQGWRRCPRCRKPFESDPFESGLCVHCYFYRSGLSVDEFWRLQKEGHHLHPYNIGRKSTKNLDLLHHIKERGWRRALKEQI